MSDHQNRVAIVKTMGPLVKMGTHSRSSMQNQHNFMMWKHSTCVLSVQKCFGGQELLGRGEVDGGVMCPDHRYFR